MLFINKLGNSLISNYPTDKQNAILTYKMMKIKRLFYPLTAILLMMIVCLILIGNSEIESYFAIFFISLLFGFFIAFFIIQKMDKKFMQLVYFQQNTSKYILLVSCIGLWLFSPFLIAPLIFL